MLVTDRRPAVIALAMSLSLLTGGLVATTASPARAADDVTAGLVLRYKLDEASGTVAADSSGHGRDGTVSGGATWSGDQGLAFNGTDTYVKVPDDVMGGLSSISVDFDVNVAPAQATPYFVYGFGNTDTATGYGNGYLFATGNAFRASISTSNWVGEQTTAPSPGRNLARGAWKHVTYTQTGGTGVLYEDGVAVGTNTGITVLPSAIGGGHTTANYLGRSLYTGDRYFNGRLRDFRVYDRALTATEVGTLAERSNTEAVAADTAALTLGDTSAVVSNLTLPATGAGGSAITWSSGDAAVVSDAGVVTRPAGTDATVTLTATVRRGAVSATKAFTVVVVAANDQGTVAAAARALVVRNAGDVRGNLTLPAAGESGTAVSWASSDPAVISAAGEVHRPAHGAGAASVTLTATVRLNAASATRDITATVPELPAAAPLKGYLFSYFTGEGTANGEQVYNALSNGNDALSWREINDGNPVLTSTLGTQGLRDPFIIRSPEGDKFYQIATDLKIYGNGDWDASQRTGSKSIMVWESTDLVHWTDQRLVKVSPDTAGNTWAPEAFYDEGLGAYVVFWASKLYDATDPGHTGSTYNRMMYATTRDFWTFSEPKVWKDPGYSVIDSTVVKHGGTYYRITKDERNNTSSTPCSKFLIEEKSTELRDLDYDLVAECIGKGSLSAGEGPLVFKSNTAEKWYLFIDEFGGRGYVPFETTDLDSGTWSTVPSYSLPSRPRHGTVLPVTAAEYDRLLAAYQPDQYAASVSPVAATTGAGQAPVLPATVPATYGDGVVRSAAVTWDAVDPAAYAGTGTFTVGGTLVDNASARATATVTVVADPVPQSHLRLRYEFDETSGAVARDSSGNGFDGTYNRTPGHGTGVHGGSFAMSGGASSSTTAPYLTIPNGVLKGASAVTVSTWVKWNASTTVNQWIYGLGPDSTKYLFSSPRNGGGILYSAITTGSWSTEFGLRNGTALPGGWQHLAVTVDAASRTAVMYLNGAKVATATGVTVAPSDLYDATKTATGYVGRSLYAADPYFAGEVDDFRVYDVALSPAEILELAGRTASIAAVTLPQLKVDAIVDDAAGVVTLPLREGTDVARLAPELTPARGATISPASGTVRDLTKPVTYTVTGSDGAVRTWTVRALVMRSPVLPGLYADPNIAVFGDTFWIYPTTDGFAGWSGTQFHAFSSTDLVHWTDHGVALDLGPDVSWADDSAWAPTIAAKNGKYYLYFSGGASSGDTRKQLGVAVADSPAGPFRDALGKPLVAAGSYPGQMIDADVFTDDDGASYLYWGNGNSYQVRLNDDLTSFDPAQVRTYHPANYNEGSFVFKRGGTYYFSWSENDTRSPDYQVAYATGGSPLGPWSDRKGVILAKDAALGILGTGHHSVVRLPNSDEWYVAYHRFAIPGGDGTHRETTVDRLRFEADGSIRPVVPTLESVDPVTVAHAGADASGVEGSAIPLRGAVSNDSNRPVWSYAAGPGGDAGATCTFADAHATGTTVTCTDDGTYTVTLTAGASQDTAQVTVTNAAPVVAAPGERPAPDAPVATGVPVTLPVSFTDAGRNDGASCTADWGDGATSSGVVSGTTCRVTHTYARAGLFRPVVTVRDDDGGASAPVTMPYVVTYAAGTGSVAGSGWFVSPMWGLVGGQMTQGGVVGRAATGVADLAFTAGPRAGGATWFEFAAGGLRFAATSQLPALVVGPVATYAGTGTVNGVGGHAFLVTAVDGGRSGADLVSLTVWDPRGRLLYSAGPIRLAGGGIVTSPRR